MAIAKKSQFQLDETDRKIIQFQQKFPLATNKEIAEEVGISVTALSNRVRKTAFKQAVGDLAKTCDDLLLRGQKDALRCLIRMVNTSPSERTKLKAAEILLKPMLDTKRATGGGDRSIIIATKIGEQGQLKTHTIEAEEEFDEGKL